MQLRRLALTLSLLYVTISAFAQNAVIRGTVIDEFGDPAYGVTVKIPASDPLIGTASDLDGAYQLTVPADGAVSVQFSFIGYADQTITDVTAEAGEVTFLDAQLQEQSELLDEVVVVAAAIKSSDIALTKIRQGSDKILDGISAQEMSRLSLSSAASAMTRVTGTTIVDGKFIVVRGLGDRYSTAQLNGLEMPSTDPYRNSPQLDLIPSSLLDNIVTSKTFSPDQPGSFTGGNVNLQTKSFPDQQTISVSVSAGLNTQTFNNDNFLVHAGGGNDYLGYDDGTRALPSRLLELADERIEVENQFGTRQFNPLSTSVQTINFAREEFAQIGAAVEEAADILPTDFSTRTDDTPKINHSLSLAYGDRIDLGGDRQLGFVFSGKFDRDYAHYDNGRNALFILEDREATALNPFFEYNDTRSAENPTVGLFGTGTLRLAQGQTITALGVYSHNTEITTRRLFGSAPGYNIDAPAAVDNTVLDFLERSTFTGQLSGEHALTAAGDFRLNWSAAVTESSQNTPNLRFLSVVKPRGFDDPSAVFRQNELGQPSNFFRDLKDEQGEVKLDLFKDFTGGHKLQGGIAYRDKTREFSERIFESFYVGLNSLRPIAAGVDSFFMDDNAGVITLPNGDQRVNNFINDISQDANSYSGSETISAAYLMGTYKVSDKFRAIVGVRAENTNLFVESRDSTLADSIRIGSIEQTDFLPSVNLVYSPAKGHNIRASFTQTLARPNMREIAIFPSFEFSGGPRFSGNPQLKLTSIDNYDLRYEYFPSGGGIISASFFYKKFRDPIVQTFLTGQVSPFFTYVNVEEANVYGTELEFRHDLGILAPALSRFSVGTNLSLIESRAAIDQEEVERNNLPSDTRPLQGQSPFIVNGNLAYADRDNGFDAAVSYNMFGNRLAFIGNRGTPDVYERGRASLDITASKEFAGMTVSVAAQNLLDPSYETFASYSGTDFVFSEYRRGRTFQVSLGYTFKG